MVERHADRASGPIRVPEPGAVGVTPGSTADWRASGLSAKVEAARLAAREAVGVAIAQVSHPHMAATMEWAAAELAIQHCLDLGLDALYKRLGTPRPPPARLLTDLATREPATAGQLRRLLNASDARSHYAFLEDFLVFVNPQAICPLPLGEGLG